MRTLADAVVFSVVLLTTSIASAQPAPDFRKPPAAEWPLVGGDWGNTRYSTLAKINTSNVKTLKGAMDGPPEFGLRSRLTRSKARRWSKTA